MSSKYKPGSDLTSRVFGRWTVLGFSHVERQYYRYWICECACGKDRDVQERYLLSGRSKSCGCGAGMKNRRHGLSNNKVHKAWRQMWGRCTRKHQADYSFYGGRGIRVCERWKTFELFLEDVGMPPTQKHSLDRVNNNGNYEPGNCRWATHTQQVRNTRQTIMLTLGERTMAAGDWADELGINSRTIKSRIRYGWAVEDILSPVITKRHHGKPKNDRDRA
jgi:hypothetical protein